ncbi:BadF/BadG/BcrA/BcrD ATPase family protein [Nonomuraea pusilla]|uniref:BadF/BadG/BcrA/BcrD ATPase family protein n=1 Tax=Nonomuraea pusilla TaxID=46177 RepID=UPI003322D1E2
MSKTLVIGVDAGATSTRVAVHALDGTRVGYARAGAGNPSAHGLAKAVAAIATALDRALDQAGQALGGHDGAAVAASLAGVAGQSDALVPELAKVWAERGIPDGPRIIRDVPIAYAAGSPEPSGSLLLSGTGAVAARIVEHEHVDAIADGLGWLLGDAGSGFWIGRAAAQAVIEALDRAAPGTGGVYGLGVLGELVVEHFLGQERPPTPRAAADRIVRLAQADHMRLAALSALVSEAATAGDPAAAAIVEQAAAHLTATLARIHLTGPVVLAGSVLTSEGPVRTAVLERLAGRDTAVAGDAAGAAAWLAARPHLTAAAARSLHAAFTARA